ncbi:MAG: hypothetical protein E7375_00745 [Clostridiales bacterium]|nr:hypothetical protein [Clostridiales bacterium]
MKVKRRSLLFRGMILVVAFALAILCAPIDSFTALAALSTYTDFTYMTIGREGETLETVVTQGDKYYITNAYIGGQTDVVVGKNATATADDGSTLEKSSVTVKYYDEAFEELSAEGTDITNKVIKTEADAKSYGYFEASNLGTYTITYSYTYKVGGKEYTNNYELKVISQLPSASFSFEDNDKHFLPAQYDLKWAKDGETYKDLYLPTPTVLNKDGEDLEVADANFVTELPATPTGKYVVVTAKGGATNTAITPQKDADGQLYIDGDTFKTATEGAQDYTIKYAYYLNGQFVTSTTKTTRVYSEANPYRETYGVDIKLESDWTDNGQTGVEVKLPKAIAVTSSSTTPTAGEEIEAHYTVKVYYSANADLDWEPITEADYNTAEEKIVNADGTLVDASKFKPMKDGWYTFEYQVTDVYGKTAKTKMGVYNFANIKDEKKPTPYVYDASASDKKEDATYKMANRVNPNGGIIVYAIGMEDNMPGTGELSRKIYTDDNVEKLVIDNYDEYNLVFNYRASAENAGDAYAVLTNNNYYIKKAIKDSGETVSSDAEMLEWLAGNGYKIVVDDANYKTIYNIFKADVLASYTEDTVMEYFKSEAGATAGFAYIKSSQTFGATTADGGMGNGQYYVRYVAKDAAGNENEVSKSMYVSSYVDYDAPTLKFTTTLNNQYLPTAKITFDAPQATDPNSYDDEMLIKTMYRYTDGSDVVAVDGKTETENLTEVWADLGTDQYGDMVDGVLVTEKYDAYKGEGYIDITDKDASTYTIDLSEAPSTAKKLQIVVYAYDNNGNVGFYAQTVNILNVTDNKAPEIISIPTGYESEYMQDEEIEIPEVVVSDDAVGYMSYDIKVYYGDDNEEVSYYGDYQERKASYNGSGKYTVKGAKFTAGAAGDYRVVVSVSDYNNNTVVAFFNYTVKGRMIVSDPKLNDLTIEREPVELDDYLERDENGNVINYIELPTPKISYDIPDSVTEDVFVESGSTKTYVIRGVDQNGTATMYSTTQGQEGMFVPTKVGTVKIGYSATVELYNQTMFTWDEAAGYYTTTDGTIIRVLNKNEYNVETLMSGSFKIVKAADGSVSVTEGSTTIDNATLQSWFEELRVYELPGEEYTIKVQDTKINEEAIRYDYEPVLEENEGIYTLNVQAIKALDASGIDFSKSYVTLRWTLADGTSDSKTWKSMSKDEVYTIDGTEGKKVDGTYTLTYYIWDKAGNEESKAYTFAVGDNVAPTVSFKDGFVATSYEVGTSITIDPTKINKSDASGCEDPIITLYNKSAEANVELTKEGELYKVALDEVGSYTLTVEVKDKNGNTTKETFDFEVTAKSKDATMTYKVVGTVLIVLSVVILAGVVIYFIVSKVKLDKELKK